MPSLHFYPWAILFAFITLALPKANAQSSASVNWTISAPNSPQGYVAGETISICLDINNIFFVDTSLVHGFQFDFPEGLNYSSINISQYPAACSQGTWNWYESITSSASGQSFGPGFFFDSPGSSDGNPGNNLGENCPFSSYSFCFEINTIQDCSPNTDTDLSPTLNIYGDGTSGAWTSVNSIITAYPANQNLMLNCCGVNSGLETTIALCENQDMICPFELLQGNPSEGGVWTVYGPNGNFVSFFPTYDACFDASVYSYENYVFTYTIGEEPCIPSSTDLNVSFVDAPLDETDFTASICIESNPIDLGYLLNVNPIPAGIIWTDVTNPASGIPFSNPIDPSIYPANTTLNLAFQSNTGLCDVSGTMTLSILPADADAGSSSEIEICPLTPPFPLIEALGGSPQLGGVWTHPLGYEMNGIYSPGSMSDGLYTYTITTTCDTSMASLNIIHTSATIIDTSIAVCDAQGSVNLFNYLPPGMNLGGQWTTNLGNFLIPIFPSTEENEGTYTYWFIENGCSNYFNINLSIDTEASAGPDQTLSLCTDGSPVDLFEYLAPSTSALGEFSNNNFPSTASNNGSYTYYMNNACGSDSASYTVEFLAQVQLLDYVIACSDTDPSEYYVIAQLASGTMPFSSDEGSFVNDVFTSGMMSLSTQPQFIINISDANACSLSIVGAVEGNNGLCAEEAIIGCQDPIAQNYNPFATVSGTCEYGFWGGLTTSYNPSIDLEGGRPSSDSPFKSPDQRSSPEPSWDFTLFPNPKGKDQALHVRIQNLSTESTLQVRDLTGRLIWTETLNSTDGQSFKVLSSAPALQAGTYLISISMPNNQSKTRTLLITQ